MLCSWESNRGLAESTVSAGGTRRVTGLDQLRADCSGDRDQLFRDPTLLSSVELPLSLF